MTKRALRWRRASALLPLLLVGLAALLSARTAISQTVDTTLWCPDANVLAVAVGGGRVFISGNFSSIRGTPRAGLASLDAATGRLTDWDPQPNGGVYALAVGDGLVYVGGGFTTIAGAPREYLAAFDVTTGALQNYPDGAFSTVSALTAGPGYMFGAASTPTSTSIFGQWYGTEWSATVGGTQIDGLAVGGGRVYACGTFNSINGIPRTNVAALAASTGTVAAWSPNPNGHTYAVAVDGDVVYLGGTFNQVGLTPVMRNKLAAVNVTTGVPTAWKPGAGGTVTDLIAANGVVYVAGGFSAVDGANRYNLAAINEIDGLVTSWDPNPSSAVYALALDGPTVYVGGNFPSICGQPVSYLARMPDSPTGTLLARFDAEVASDGVHLTWEFQTPTSSVVLERADSPDGPWTVPPVELRQTGEQVDALDRTVEPGRTFWYRLVATLLDGTQAAFGPIQAHVPESITRSGITLISPNPTASAAHIDYQVARQERVRLSVVDAAGREVALLCDQTLAPGRYAALWDRTGGRGPQAAGVYFLRWQSPSQQMQRRVIVLR